MAWMFDAPANLQDFQNPADWNKVMVDEANGIVLDLVAAVLQKSQQDVTAADIHEWAPKLSYAHPATEVVPANAETLAVDAWGGFPRAVDRRAPWTQAYPPIDGDLDGTLRAVDDVGDEDWGQGVFVDRHGRILNLPVRHRQDEYLEWMSQYDADGRLTKIIFVAEGYDYFAALFEKDQNRVLDLYKEFTGVTTVKIDDLRAVDGIYRRTNDGRTKIVVEPGGFNPRNQLNIKPGIVHLSHRANSLGAEVNLAGVSALARRKADGSPVDGADEEELLCCNQGGDPNRNSDPKISQQAYALVRQGYRYTLANPIGLYIAGINEAGLTLPDGTPVPREWWNVVRGHDLWSDGTSRVLRLEIRPPAGETIRLGDLQAGGATLKYPGQIARLLSVHLFVTRWKRPDGSLGPVVGCDGTCCRLSGTSLLVPSSGDCQPGFEPAFPGLLPSSGPGITAKLAKKGRQLR
ncbi:hypothetical protein [Burkholderia pseudomallei]|uniref:hypothetical protein n=1 Tax=Burkholderia pseudomallei TaxID=28450 RepID=UPI001269EC7A|nr:hypothetical protein [Burkholderia pseudomallei]